MRFKKLALRNLSVFSALGGALLAAACGGRGDGTSPSNGPCASCEGDGDGGLAGGGDIGKTITEGPFTLRADFAGPCEKVAGLIDLNLGNSPENTVRALHCQITGEEPSAAISDEWSKKLKENPNTRRIDVAWNLCNEVGRNCELTFSDPWEAQVLLEQDCERSGTRDIGAVFMFFSDCPEAVNCGRYWANTHAVGMDRAHALYGYADNQAGFYNPDNVGFWRRELLDARWAGLQFLMPNTYGFDLTAGELHNAVEALDDIGGGIGLALMDDTWGWRTGSPPPFNVVPNLDKTEEAAHLIYDHKWKPYFSAVPDEHRYKRDGRPLIYFYNAGTLQPREKAPALISRLKELFNADFGVDPFVIVDGAFFADEEGMNAVADGRFTWDSFKYGGPSRSELNDHVVTHAMVRWDSVGRDRGQEAATSDDFLRKGPEDLEAFLDLSKDADVSVIATWNDLGEGTGINRNFDYYYKGEWLEPNYFMNIVRQAQCKE